MLSFSLFSIVFHDFMALFSNNEDGALLPFLYKSLSLLIDNLNLQVCEQKINMKNLNRYIPEEDPIRLLRGS